MNLPDRWPTTRNGSYGPRKSFLAQEILWKQREIDADKWRRLA